jgi:hypothetical protein
MPQLEKLTMDCQCTHSVIGTSLLCVNVKVYAWWGRLTLQVFNPTVSGSCPMICHKPLLTKPSQNQLPFAYGKNYYHTHKIEVKNETIICYCMCKLNYVNIRSRIVILHASTNANLWSITIFINSSSAYITALTTHAKIFNSTIMLQIKTQLNWSLQSSTAN